MDYEAIVVGGGPAGMGAGLFLARAGLTVLLIDGGHSHLHSVSRIPNFPGLLEEISGAELLSRMQSQCELYGAKVHEAEVNRVRDEGGVFCFETAAGDAFTAQYVLLATHKNPTVSAQLGLRKDGVFIATDNRGRTSYPKVYAAGVARGIIPGHAVSSAGDGAFVAVSLVGDMRGEGYKDHTE
jgi:thioredoxin reductase